MKRRRDDILDRNILRLIRMNKRTVIALVTLLLERYRRFEEEEDLSKVYEYCLREADVVHRLFRC